MQSTNRRLWVRLFSLVLLLCGLSLSPACLSKSTPAATPDPTPTAAQTPQVDTTPTPPADLTATPVPPGAPQKLTVWIAELVSPLEADDRSLIFEQQIMAFEATHPGLTIEVLYKKPEGKGGMEENPRRRSIPS